MAHSLLENRESRQGIPTQPMAQDSILTELGFPAPDPVTNGCGNLCWMSGKITEDLLALDPTLVETEHCPTRKLQGNIFVCQHTDSAALVMAYCGPLRSHVRASEAYVAAGQKALAQTVK